MTKTLSTPSLGQLRDRFAARFRGLRVRGGERFASAISAPDARTERPVCWGELARHFGTYFETDEDWLEALAILLEERDLRALLLFVHAAVGRPRVLAGVFARASELPVTIQRALVAITDPDSLSPEVVANLSPAAQQLVEQGEEALAREREVVEARVAALLAFGILAPDSEDPHGSNRGDAPRGESGEGDRP